MSDLAALFPNLPRNIIQDFDNPRPGTGIDPLATDAEHGPVTDDDIEVYLQRMGSLRSPLKPVVENQQPPPSPEFARNARTAPDPSASYVEAPDYGDGATPPAPAPSPAAPAEIPPAGFQPAPPPSPGPGVPAPLPAPDLTIDDVPPAPEDVPPPLEGYSPAPAYFAPPAAPAYVAPPAPVPSPDPAGQLAGLLGGDPELKTLLSQYFQRKTAGTFAPAPAPALDPSLFEGDPAMAALAAQQQAMLQQMQVAANEQRQMLDQDRQRREQALFDQTHQEHVRIINATASQFKDRYKLSDAQLQSVREAGARTGVLDAYMRGQDPITGAAVTNPDIHTATWKALTVGYNLVPETQQLERDRIIARARSEQARRTKLGGVGGSGGSAPRSVPAPTDPAGARDAMNREVAEMFSGNWNGN